MLALYLALSMGLVNPFWSMMTVYIVSQPHSGSVRSKALYRLFGTAVGAIFATLVVPPLSNAPELLALVLALWVGLCLWVSLLDRTPRSYVFMLSGYTAALIGFPSVTMPGAIFDVSVARVEEIWLGITCATIVHSVFLPQGIASRMTERIDQILGDVQAWMQDVLTGRHDPQSPHAHRIAADISELHLLSTHLPFDTSHFRDRSREVAALADSMATLLPLAGTVGDRLDALRQQGASLGAECEALIADIASWVALGRHAPRVQGRALADRVRALEPIPGEEADLPAYFAASFHARLADLIANYDQCLVLGRHLRSRRPQPRAIRRLIAAMPTHSLHVDYGMAAWSAASAVIAVLAVCTIWIATGWPDGGTAAMMTSIFMCFFAAMDDPAKAIHSFALSWLVSLPFVALYLFAILPLMHGFPTLMLALAPFLLLGGWLIAQPRWTLKALPAVMGFAGSLGIQESFAPDFATFANGSIAALAGVMMASVVTRLIRSVGVGYSARRIVRRGWAEIARFAKGRNLPDDRAWIMRMVDRAGLLGPRLAVSAEARVQVADALGELRVGLNVLSLRRLVLANAAQSAGPVQVVLDALGGYFADRAKGRFIAPPPLLLGEIDEALRAASLAPPTLIRREGLLALTGLRRALFPQSLQQEVTA